MIAAVRIDGGIAVKAGDLLEHATDGTTRPQSDPVVTKNSFARVIDPTPGETAPDGSYRVRCEVLVQRPFIPKHERTSA
ncbi:hypothetical protein [Devosia sp.]|uniref:hypothetical protein n=1 Tax=Devosia sp. TaxID=1871048 RepID=UPI00292D9062|nr:hypothetical protein [Devosia sp.]